VSLSWLAARLRREEGQVVAMLAAGLLVFLLGVVGLVLDVGHAYSVKRKLQASADAAALAGAASLPDIATASSVALTYGASGAKNALAGATVDPPTGVCLPTVKYCFGNPTGGTPTNGQANGLVVQEHAQVPTTFLGLFGVDTIDVGATSTACGLCSTKPVDVALVVDRTGSMAGEMGDLRAGIDTFLESLDPSLDYVSLLVLPPAPSGDPCVAAASQTSFPLNPGDSYPLGSDGAYVVTHLSHDYLTADGQLDPSSQLVQQVGCLKAAGSTSYTKALAAAETELTQHGSGRQDVQRMVVFESDGAANTAPDSDFDSSTRRLVGTVGFYSPTSSGSDEVLRPCGSAVDRAGTLQASGTYVFTVAYKTGDDTCYQAPHRTGSGVVGYKDQSEGLTAAAALADMASPGDGFSAGSAAEMQASFAAIANKITGASLVPNS
jgi:Flp pilus assembly protein TadG